ncbi:hypothetical protein BH11ARM2_BH11ARM2_33000 [soil metagenome]
MLPALLSVIAPLPSDGAQTVLRVPTGSEDVETVFYVSRKLVPPPDAPSQKPGDPPVYYPEEKPKYEMARDWNTIIAPGVDPLPQDLERLPADRRFPTHDDPWAGDGILAFMQKVTQP